MKSILILQNEIKEYRKPLYNSLAQDYEIVVLHSGLPSVGKSDQYREVITKVELWWRFHIQPNSPLATMVRDFDVVIAMFDISWPAYLIPLFWSQRPKYILWGHWYSTSQLSNLVRNLLMKKADRLLMYGGEEIDRMVSNGIPRHKIIIAPNTVHIQNPTDLSRNPKSSLIFIGRLEAESRRNSKRVDILVETFSRIRTLISDSIVLNIVGSGEEEEILKRLAAQLDLEDRVIFHGHVDNEETLSELFSHAFALVSPGHVGLSVLQSFGHGVPVVTGKAIRYRKETQHLLNVLTGSKVIMGPEYYNLRADYNSILVESLDDLESVLVKICNEPSYAQELGSNAFNHYIHERSLSHMLDGFKKGIEG